MATVSLLQYLQYGPPNLPIIQHGRSKTTTSKSYGADDVTHVGVWGTFDLPTIQAQAAQHGQILAAQINPDSAPTSPGQQINTENGVRARFDTYIRPRLRRALRAGCGQVQVKAI